MRCRDHSAPARAPSHPNSFPSARRSVYPGALAGQGRGCRGQDGGLCDQDTVGRARAEHKEEERGTGAERRHHTRQVKHLLPGRERRGAEAAQALHQRARAEAARRIYTE